MIKDVFIHKFAKKWEKILILKVDFVQYFDLDIDFV